MAEKKELKKEVKPKEIIKPKLKKQWYILKRDFSIGGEMKKKGEKIELTKEGYKSLRKQQVV